MRENRIFGSSSQKMQKLSEFLRNTSTMHEHITTLTSAPIASSASYPTMCQVCVLNRIWLFICLGPLVTTFLYKRAPMVNSFSRNIALLGYVPILTFCSFHRQTPASHGMPNSFVAFEYINHL